MTARLRLLLVLVLLHLVTAVPLPWEPAAGFADWCRGSVDFALLLAGICLLAQCGARLLPPALVAALLTLVVLLYRVGETLMPVFYGKAFEPWIDLLEVPGLVHLLTHRHPPGVQFALYAAAVLGTLLLLGGLTWAWRLVGVAAQRPRFAGACLAGAQLLFVAAWYTREATRGTVTLLRPCMAQAASDDLVATLRTRRWHGDAVVGERVRAAADELAQTPQDLGALRGVDLYFLIVESYGRGILGNQARATHVAWLHEHERALQAAGWESAAGWIAPSVRGGGSSLAHAELLSGIDVEDRRIFDALLASSVRTLAAIARDAGYHTLDVQPAMPREWPEAKSLGFVEDMFFRAFRYQGRPYHWGVMPDQYALAQLLADVVGKREQPLFVEFVGVTSHAPFAMVPPYYDDWSRVLAPDAFTGPPAAQWDISWTSYAGHPQVIEAYLGTIRYCLRTMFGFAQQLRRPSLVVVVGDHQPPLEFHERSERVFDVPIHVSTNRPGLLTPLLGQGLEPGLVPAAEGASFDASRFLFRFLRAYGSKGK